MKIKRVILRMYIDFSYSIVYLNDYPTFDLLINRRYVMYVYSNTNEHSEGGTNASGIKSEQRYKSVGLKDELAVL